MATNVSALNDEVRALLARLGVDEKKYTGGELEVRSPTASLLSGASYIAWRRRVK